MKKLSLMFMVLLSIATISANTFTKVTSAPEDWSGQYLVVYEKSATEAWIFNGKDEAQDYVTATIADGKIVSDDLDQYAVTVAAMNGGYSIKVGAQYMGGDASNNTIKFNAQPILNTISMDSVVYFTSNTSVLRFNSTSTKKDNKETCLRFRYYKAATYAKQRGFQLYKGTVEPIITKIDTISVTEARARIDAGKLGACYVYGVVATTPSDPGSYKNTIFWMTDIKNPNDSLEGYKISGLNGADILTIKDIPFGLGDTIMIFANNLALYNSSIYETSSGYFAAMLGKTNMQDVSANYPYGLGALYQGEESGKHKWDIAIQVSETDNKGVVFAIKNNDNHGIAGNYSLAENSTYNADGTPVAISGSVKIKYASTSATGYNMYEVVSTFKAGNNMYRIEGTYELPGWKADLSDNVSLENDVPFTPTPGAEITCAQAKEFALSLESGATSDIEVTVIGYATSMLDAQSSSTQQSFWMDDEKGTKKTFEAFYCDIPVGKKVVVGTKVAVTGKVSNYNGTTAEMKNGKIRILEGGEEVKREAVIESIPENAITVTQAIEIGNALTAEVGATTESDAEYVVLGYVAKVSYAMKNDTATWFMTDEQGATFGDLQAYKCKIAADIYAGDQVFVIGKIAKYQKDASTANIEIAKGEGHFAALTTDIKEVIATIAEKVKTVKVFVNGQLYIIRDGKTYTTQGILVE